ncbi:MAG: energy transducer TonB [Deltaproteobacteria bacterium]
MTENSDRQGDLWVETSDIFKDFKQEPASWGNSVLVHLVVLAALIIPYIKALGPATRNTQTGRERTMIYLPPPSVLGMDRDPHGGGGSGTRTLTLPSKGAIPPFSNNPIVPALVKASQALPVPPALLGDPNLQLPEMKLNMNWGDPTGVPGDLSGGPGSGGSFGNGDGTGIGPGKGPGYQHGEDGGYGGKTFQPGRGGVSEPVPIFKPEPPYTEEARKTKLQGVVDLMIVVDPDGNVAFARLLKPLGMGLDESALQTVKTWRFKPALRNGSPVPVRVMVQVSFRLF